MAASSLEIEDFLTGPLVTWVSTCIRKPEMVKVFENFFDGGPLKEVLLQIDPEPTHPIPTLTTSVQGLSLATKRTQIFYAIIKSIKLLYESELDQVIVALPDCVVLGNAPTSHAAVEQLRLLLLLLLGCAVQGPTKEHFITRIKEQLSLDCQSHLVECIKKITETQTVVLTAGWPDQSLQLLYSHVCSLVAERDNLLQQLMNNLSKEPSTPSPGSCHDGVESNHLAVELADLKSRLRKQRQELEEKSEILTECKEELEHANTAAAKLKVENSELLTEARKAKQYRDEADAMVEKAERADRLESEAQRYRERLADADFYRVRVEELREDNRVLLETREMLESQLARARQRAEVALELEDKLVACKQTINDALLERDAAKDQLQLVKEENEQLQQIKKEATAINLSADSDEEPNSGDNSLSEQLTNNAQARALKLELENQKLQSLVDSLKEHNFHQNSAKILELEKEKKQVILENEQLQKKCERLSQQNLELENLFKNALQENRKLQDNIDGVKVTSERQAQELQNEHVKTGEMEKIIDALTKDKQKIQSLYDSTCKRGDDAEKSLNQFSEQIQLLKEKQNGLEKENNGFQKEIHKLRESLETKDVSLDEFTEKCEKQVKEIDRLNKENECVGIQVEKLQEFEHKAQELLFQSAIHAETIVTLQKDLISEKITNEKFKTSLEKLGLTLNVLDNDINVIAERILSNPDLSKTIILMLEDKATVEQPETKQKCPDPDDCDVYSQTEHVVSTISAEWNQQCEKLCSELSNLQQTNETLHTDNARMQVDIATLTSQVNSLSSQQTALQLANSQLVAEKEEMARQQILQNNQHDTLLYDQAMLRTLHEQLNSEYEELKKDQEPLKKLNRDLRSETRNLKETNASLEKRISTLEHDKESLKNESKNLGNLRAEHSKLKDDFRNLFTANERLKTEYRALQDAYKNLRSESGKLRLGNTEMQGELSTRSDLVAGLQYRSAALQERCDMLLEMNSSLDSDRRALMDHVSQLLSQYHSLLTHSLEDKQHYHLEEKIFTDKLNNLCRQKEKLEEKIMEHYRKLDNASSKKKGFGATLVRRVRKAGSDIINKVPSRNRRSWHEDSRLTQSQFTLGGGSGESGGNDSDNSFDDAQRSESFKRGSLHGQKPKDEIALRRSYRDSSHKNNATGESSFPQEPGSALSLGSVGSRRTVYLSDDDPAPASSSANQNPPPLLVYNRISTVYGDTQKNPQSQVPNSTDDVAPQAAPADRNKSETSKENAIWYEYGCV